MTELWDLHRRAGEILAESVKRIRQDQWHLPTPCTEWDVRDLVHHFAWSNLWVGPLVEGRSLEEVAPELEGDVLGDDPLGVTLRSIDESSDAFERGYDRTVQLSRGMTSAREYCGERMNDLVVHSWDLAAAIDGDRRLDEECMEAGLEVYRPFEAALRRVGALGPDVEVPEGADLQTRYLAFFGRRADWTQPG